MYLSKALMNMRGNSLGANNSLTVQGPWLPTLSSAYNTPTRLAWGHPISDEYAGCIVFSTGDTVPDDVWNVITASAFSLTTLRTYLAAQVPGCVMDANPISTGPLRLVNKGEGVRMFDLTNNVLGKFVYAKAFNRMYMFIGSSTVTLTATQGTVLNIVEFTPQDLIAMGATLTDLGDGTFMLPTSGIVMNNIAFS